MKGVFHWSSGHAFYGSKLEDILTASDQLDKSGKSLGLTATGLGAYGLLNLAGTQGTASQPLYRPFRLPDMLEVAVLTAALIMFLGGSLIVCLFVSWTHPPGPGAVQAGTYYLPYTAGSDIVTRTRVRTNVHH